MQAEEIVYSPQMDPAENSVKSVLIKHGREGLQETLPATTTPDTKSARATFSL